jgi:molybdate transport system substrate-binding protein
MVCCTIIFSKYLFNDLDFMKFRQLFALVFGFALSVCAVASHCETINFFAAAGVKVPAEAIIAAFEKQTGHSVTRIYDTAGAAEEKFVAAGKSGVLITTEVRINKSSKASATESGALQAGKTLAVGDTLAGVAMSAGFSQSNPSIKIDTAEKLKHALLAAKRIAFSDPTRGATVGVHFVNVIEKLGIKDEVLAKATKAKDGIETMKLVTACEADLGITQVSEIVQSQSKLLLGAFPKEHELATRYSYWVANAASDATKALADAFHSEAALENLTKNGLRVP